MNDENDTQPRSEVASIEQLQRHASRGYSKRDDAAFTAAAVVSAGLAMFLATWGSGVLGSGLPRVGYFIGIAIVSWFVSTFALGNLIIALEERL